MMKYVNRFAQDESGATAIEYGLIASLIAVAIIGAVTTLGTKLTATFGSVSASLKLTRLRGQGLLLAGRAHLRTPGFALKPIPQAF